MSDCRSGKSKRSCFFCFLQLLPWKDSFVKRGKVGGQWLVSSGRWRESAVLQESISCSENIGQVLQSVLDSWPDPRNCSHFLAAARINWISLNDTFTTDLRLKINFLHSGEYLKKFNFCRGLYLPLLVNHDQQPPQLPPSLFTPIKCFHYPGHQQCPVLLDCVMYCLFAGFQKEADGWIQKGFVAKQGWSELWQLCQTKTKTKSVFHKTWMAGTVTTLSIRWIW